MVFDPETFEINRRRYVGTTAAALAALGGSSNAVSAAGCDDKKHKQPPEETSRDIDSCTTIDEPGYYRLAQDLEGESEESCVEIVADGVVFDGGGNTISGGSTGVEVTDADDVVVRNLSVEHVAVGVAFADCSRSLVYNVSATEISNGVVVVDSVDCLVRNVATDGATNFGILGDESARIVVRECLCFGGGIRFTTGVDRSIIAYNEVREATNFAGISISEDAEENQIAYNVVTDGSESGIRLFGTDGNIVARNESTDNDGFGIELEEADENVVANNTLEDNGEGPCSVVDSEDNVFVGNEPPCDPDE